MVAHLSGPREYVARPPMMWFFNYFVRVQHQNKETVWHHHNVWVYNHAISLLSLSCTNQIIRFREKKKQLVSSIFNGRQLECTFNCLFANQTPLYIDECVKATNHACELTYTYVLCWMVVSGEERYVWRGCNNQIEWTQLLSNLVWKKLRILTILRLLHKIGMYADVKPYTQAKLFSAKHSTHTRTSISIFMPNTMEHKHHQPDEKTAVNC